LHPALALGVYRKLRASNMKEITQVLLGLIRQSGAAGLLVLGILDSSFLFAPLGNDLLVVALTAHSRSVPRMLYYAGMATIGSVLGCLLVDVVFRKAGEEGLKKHLRKTRLDYVRRKMMKSAAWAIALASIAPPPFPFTPFIMAASALQYPRKKLLAVVGVVRMIRFSGLGVLALLFGKSILNWGESDVVQDLILALLGLFVIGSTLSVYGWIRRSRS
jgi:membrane protein YqaA with SNARE-associated domain